MLAMLEEHNTSQGPGRGWGVGVEGGAGAYPNADRAKAGEKRRVETENVFSGSLSQRPNNGERIESLVSGYSPSRLTAA